MVSAYGETTVFLDSIRAVKKQTKKTRHNTKSQYNIIIQRIILRPCNYCNEEVINLQMKKWLM